MPKPLKHVHAPHLGHDVVLGGRKRPVARGHMLHADRLLLATLPPPPSSTSYRTGLSAALKTMLLNNVQGDCVIASGGHRIGLMTGAAGAAFVYTDAQAEKDYEAIGGYVPGDPSTDQGCDMVTNNNYRVSNGYADGSKDLGWIAVDAANKTQIQQIIYLFENVDFGMELPDAWISPFPSADGFVWDVAGAPDEDNGHCVPGVDYDSIGVDIVTWALEGKITWAAVAEYAATKNNGELYCHINADQLAKGMAKAPNGVDWNALITYFNELGGNLPVPAPTPAPTPAPPAPTPAPPAPLPPIPPPGPTPAPTPMPPVVTLKEAQAAVVNALDALPTKITTRSHAGVVAAAALAKLTGWPT